MLSCKGSFGHLQCFLLSYFKSRMLSQTVLPSILFKMRVYSARKEGRKVDATSRLQGRKEEEASWWKSFHESFLWETVVSVVQKFLFVFSIWLFCLWSTTGLVDEKAFVQELLMLSSSGSYESALCTGTVDCCAPLCTVLLMRVHCAADTLYLHLYLYLCLRLRDCC